MIISVIAFCLFLLFWLLSVNVPVAVQILSPFLLYYIAKPIIRLVFKIELAAGNDQVFQTSTNGILNAIVGAMILERRISTAEFLEKLYQRLLDHPYSDRFRMTLHRFYFVSYWKFSKTFNIKNHVSLITEPVKSQDELQEFLAKHLEPTYPFAAGQPEWIIYVFEKYLENKSVVVLKVHHAYGDGISLQSYFSYIGGDLSYEIVHLPKPNALQRVYLTFLGILRLPKLAMKMIRPRDMNFFRSPKTRLTGRKLIASSKAISIENIRTITKKVGCSLNDFVLMSVMRSLRIYGEKYRNESLKNLYMLIATSLRTPEKVMQIRNMVMGFFFDYEFPSEKRTGTEKYSELIHLSSSFKKANSPSDPNIYWLITELLSLMLPLKIMDRYLVKLMNSKTSCFCSNVPGPKSPFFFLGHEMENAYFCANLMGDNGLGFLCFSYNGKITISILVDEACQIEPKAYVTILEEVIAEYFSR